MKESGDAKLIRQVIEVNYLIYEYYLLSLLDTTRRMISVVEISGV